MKLVIYIESFHPLQRATKSISFTLQIWIFFLIYIPLSITNIPQMMRNTQSVGTKKVLQQPLQAKEINPSLGKLYGLLFIPQSNFPYLNLYSLILLVQSQTEKFFSVWKTFSIEFVYFKGLYIHLHYTQSTALPVSI